jgi:hypothetical protein
MNMYDEINELVKNLDPNKIDYDLEDEIFTKAYTLFINKIGAEKTDSSYRAHGWYYRDFRRNNIDETFCFRIRSGYADATYQQRYIWGKEGFPFETLVSKYMTKLNVEQDGE